MVEYIPQDDVSLKTWMKGALRQSKAGGGESRNICESCMNINAKDGRSSFSRKRDLAHAEAMP